ncbi:MAG: hypothetical protein ACRD96_20555, partial [Bryobacteraceae bacterium]
FANGDPVNFSDPFGLCPVCAAAYAIFEIGATLYDVGDLAVTGIQYARGRASGTELGLTAAGVGAGVVGFGGGYGRAARTAFRRYAGSLETIGKQVDNIAGRLDRAHRSAARLENSGRLSTGYDHVQEVTDWANGLLNGPRDR